MKSFLKFKKKKSKTDYCNGMGSDGVVDEDSYEDDVYHPYQPPPPPPPPVDENKLQPSPAVDIQKEENQTMETDEDIIFMYDPRGNSQALIQPPPVNIRKEEKEPLNETMTTEEDAAPDSCFGENNTMINVSPSKSSFAGEPTSAVEDLSADNPVENDPVVEAFFATNPFEKNDQKESLYSPTLSEKLPEQEEKIQKKTVTKKVEETPVVQSPVPVTEKQKGIIYSAPTELPELEEKFDNDFFGTMKEVDQYTDSKKEESVRMTEVQDVSQDKQNAMDEIDDLVNEFNEGAVAYNRDRSDDDSSFSDDGSDDNSMDSDDDFDSLDDDFLTEMLDDDDNLIGDLDDSSSSSGSEYSTESNYDDEKKGFFSSTLPTKASTPKGSKAFGSSEEEKKEDGAYEPDTKVDRGSSSNTDESPGNEVVQNDEGLFEGMAMKNLFWDDLGSVVGEDDVSSDDAGDSGDVSSETDKMAVTEQDFKPDFGFEAVFSNPNEVAESDGEGLSISESKEDGLGPILLLDRLAGKFVEKEGLGKVDPRGTAVRTKNGKQSDAKKKSGAPKAAVVKRVRSPAKKARAKPSTPETKPSATTRDVTAESSPSVTPTGPKTSTTDNTERSVVVPVNPPVEAVVPESQDSESQHPESSVAIAVDPEPQDSKNLVEDVLSEPQDSESQLPESFVDVAVDPEPQGSETPVDSSAPKMQEGEASKAADIEIDAEKPREEEADKASEPDIISSMMKDIYRFAFGHSGSSNTNKNVSTTSSTKPDPPMTGADAPAAITPNKIAPGTPETVSSEKTPSPTAEQDSSSTAEQAILNHGYEVRSVQTGDEIHEVTSGKGFEFSQKIHTILRTSNLASKAKKAPQKEPQNKKKSKLKSLFKRKKSAKMAKQ